MKKSSSSASATQKTKNKAPKNSDRPKFPARRGNNAPPKVRPARPAEKTIAPTASNTSTPERFEPAMPAGELRMHCAVIREEGRHSQIAWQLSWFLEGDRAVAWIQGFAMLGPVSISEFRPCGTRRFSEIPAADLIGDAAGLEKVGVAPWIWADALQKISKHPEFLLAKLEGWKRSRERDRLIRKHEGELLAAAKREADARAAQRRAEAERFKNRPSLEALKGLVIAE